MLKSEVKNFSEKKELPFPKLMIHRDNDIIILATSCEDEKNIKAVVVGGGYYKNGSFDTRWASALFTDFYGLVTLTQTPE